MGNYYYGMVCGSLNNQTIKDEMKIKGVTIDELADQLEIDRFEIIKRLGSHLPHDVKQELIDGINEVFLSKRNCKDEKPEEESKLLAEKITALMLYHEIREKCFTLIDRLYTKDADVFVTVYPLLKKIEEFINEIKWNEWEFEERQKECL